MLAVDRQQRGAPARHFVHEQRTGADQDLFVREGHDNAPPDRGQRRRQAGRTDDRRHDPICGSLRRLYYSSRTAARFDPASGERLLQRGVAGGIGDGGEACANGLRLLGQSNRIVMRRHRLDGESVAVAQQEIDGVAPDRAGRTENGYPSHQLAPVAGAAI